MSSPSAQADGAAGCLLMPAGVWGICRPNTGHIQVMRGSKAGLSMEVSLLSHVSLPQHCSHQASLACADPTVSKATW